MLEESGSGSRRPKKMRIRWIRIRNTGEKGFHVTKCMYQCCGSGSESGSNGSTCFWASRIRIHWSDVWIRIRILLSSCKNSKKNLDSYYLVTLFDFYLWIDENVASKSKKQKKLVLKTSFLLASWRPMTKIAGSGSGSESISQRHGSMDPRIRIHPKMSWIRNTGMYSTSRSASDISVVSLSPLSSFTTNSSSLKN